MLGEPGWLTLGEAGSEVEITEVDEAGSVTRLKLTNLTDRSPLLLDGEELVGAKQNRILNTSVLVAVRAALAIPVICVEQGRWGYPKRRFGPADASFFASVRGLQRVAACPVELAAVGLGVEYHLTGSGLSGPRSSRPVRGAPDGLPRGAGRVATEAMPRGNQLTRQWQLLHLLGGRSSCLDRRTTRH